MAQEVSGAKRIQLSARRVAALVGGLLALLVPFYLFYLRPWMALSLPIDPWLDRQRCLIAALCSPAISLPHPIGLLALGVALLLFIVAFWQRADVWRPTREATAARVAWIVVLTTVGLSAILIEAFQALVQGRPPAPGLWFFTLLVFALAALIWDSQQPELLLQTLFGIATISGLITVLLGASLLPVNGATALWLLVAGALLLGLGALYGRRFAPTLDPLDLGLMLAFGLLALALGLLRIDSWRYAFVGDEWGFFDLATTLIHRPELHDLFTVVDSNAYHTIFSSQLQAQVMRLAGETVTGWRLASLLPFVVSVPAIYIFAYWLSGRMAAVASAGLLAASHMLLSFSMVAYNNTQALIPLTFGLALFAFAQRRESALRFYLLGAVLGSSFLVFGLARLVLLPVGLFVLFFYWTSLRRFLLSSLAIGAGLLAVAAPLLVNLGNWRGLLKATPFQSELLENGGTVGLQMARNMVAGLLAFTVNEHNTHFVVGPHLDPVSALLLLIGLAATLAGWRRRRSQIWLAASMLFWLAVSAIQQYGWISTTRMFVLVPVYAIYGGIGLAALARLLFGPDRRLNALFVGAMLCVVVLLNQVHIVRVASAQIVVPAEGLLVREFEKSAGANGELPVYVVWNQPQTAIETMILRAHQVERSRIRFITGAEALELARLCDADRAQMLLVHVDSPLLNQIDAYMDQCWPIHNETALVNQDGQTLLVRYMTPAGVRAVTEASEPSPAQDRFPVDLPVPNPRDVAVDGAGNIFVLSGEPAAVWHFDAGGELQRQTLLSQAEPWALTITTDGLLLVAHVGLDPSLTWLDLEGRVVAELPLWGSMGTPGGIAAGEDGEILLADSVLGQVVRLSADGQILSVLDAGGELVRPLSVTAAGDGAIWVLDGARGLWLKIAPDNQVISSIATDRASVVQAPRLVEDVEGRVAFSQPERQRVVLYDREGTLLDVQGGFQRPSGLALDSSGRLLVVDDELDTVAVGPAATLSAPRMGDAVRVVPEPSNSYGNLPAASTADPFVSPLSPLPLPMGQRSSGESIQRYYAPPEIASFARPRAIAVGFNPVDGGKRIYVGDAAGAGIALLSADGAFVQMLETPWPPLQEISDMAVDAAGLLYVLDSATGRLHHYGADGSYIGLLVDDAELAGDARGLFVEESGQLWIANTRAGDLLRLDPAGRLLERIAVTPGQDAQPVDLAVDAQGHLFVVDARSGQLLHLTPERVLAEAWSLAPFNTADGAHLALARDGTLYVTQPEQGALVQLRADGVPQRSWLVERPDGRAAKPVGIVIGERTGLWTVDVEGPGVIHLDVPE